MDPVSRIAYSFEVIPYAPVETGVCFMLVCQEENNMEYAIVEKANLLSVHGVFDTLDRAEAFLAGIIPLFVARGFYVDKTLCKDSFEVIPYAPKRRKRS